ncbi:MAG: hypothetical protein EOO67_16705 [Microbacterium sp.]|nr:MAG: hypothetical protein EOO67_16705 [Microbacterium sp.]
MTRSRLLLVAASTALAAAALAGCGDSDPAPQVGAGTALVGTFRLDPGRCTADGAEGTYFQMINRGGTAEAGPYFGNPDSPCADKSLNPQDPGSDGGFVTGSFQPGPSPAFNANNDALASRIVKTGSFTAIQFGISTEKTDPGTKKKNPAPEIFVADGKLSGQITAWTAAWNKLYFNQGSPKPDGSSPGLTTPVTGTYDEKTGRFELTWVSQVVGGPFDQFAGAWHLSGTFEAAK